MGVKISFLNKKIYKGEPIADILVSSPQNLKSLNCPSRFNSGAIDEFLIIFLIAAKAKGVSHFKNLEELNKKESPRLVWGSKLLKMMGVKVFTTQRLNQNIWQSPIRDKQKIVIKEYLKDHRVFMTSVIAALTFGGEWHIHDKDAIKTSFPSFLKIINKFKKWKKKKEFIMIAIDSPAAAGAGTIAKSISKHYNLLYLDTGKIYRMIAFIKIYQRKNLI